MPCRLPRLLPSDPALAGHGPIGGLIARHWLHLDRAIQSVNGILQATGVAIREAKGIMPVSVFWIPLQTCLQMRDRSLQVGWMGVFGFEVFDVGNPFADSAGDVLVFEKALEFHDPAAATIPGFFE